MLYIIFGSCKDVPMGPTAIVSLLTYQALHGLGPEYAILLCFTSGLIQLSMGILGLGEEKDSFNYVRGKLISMYFTGFMIDFVSGPVSSGFTSAVALIIVTSQMKDILGIQATGTTFLEMWISLFTEMKNTRLWDTILGVACIIILLVMRVSHSAVPKNKYIKANIKVKPKRMIFFYSWSPNFMWDLKIRLKEPLYRR